MKSKGAYARPASVVWLPAQRFQIAHASCSPLLPDIHSSGIPALRKPTYSVVSASVRYIGLFSKRR